MVMDEEIKAHLTCELFTMQGSSKLNMVSWFSNLKTSQIVDSSIEDQNHKRA